MVKSYPVDFGTYKVWYKNASILSHHREDGPARLYKNGDEEWLQNNLFHRIDGLARIFHWNNNIIQEWWINGKKIHCKDNDEFLRIIKLKLLW